ncbi:putative endopeptidase [Novosphingobium sp. Rr 2-17]|uniref:M13 family metallopeptidase n=1 Tax=Novosphingobium sp. Rr 2-17 TaxID=555793 RepID=UPI0002697AFB|nr:M13-type metalloendopeptidase [Novosphingobium sp. Rr 2-17]EIZ80707.1 putative endopeptidase [Novosphingobium sp. Rr 2-17]
MPRFFQRARISGCALSAIALSLCAPTLAQAPVSPSAPPTAKPAAAPAALPAHSADWGRYGIQTQWMDRSVKPGDDFNAYVNGTWIKTVELPADRTRWGSFNELSDLSEQRVHSMMDELLASNPAPGSDPARIAAAYKAFLGTNAINAAGLAPAQPYLDRIKAAKSPVDLMRLFGEPGFASPIGLYVDADEKKSDTYALNANITGLGLPDRDYYLKTDARSLEIRAKYKAYLAFLLGKLGYADPEQSAQAVLSLETQLAQADWDRAGARNRDLTYNKLSIADFEAMGSPGLVRTFLDSSGAAKAPYVLVGEMPPTPEELKAADIDAAKAQKLFGPGMPAVVKLVEQVPVSTWQAWMAAHFLSSNAAVLPSDIDQANFAFYGQTLTGQPQQRPRWKRGIGAVEGMAGELVGKIYAAKYFPPEQKTAMTQLVANLRKAMAANLKELAWMSPATRVEAEAKLDAFTPKIGAPDTFKEYPGLKFSPTDPLGNDIAAGAWKTQFQMNRIGKPVDRAEWGMLPETVNAYYNATLNEIVFPAAILQPPFFNLTADPAVNYGAIGAVIGHEMGHGFDDQGAKSDGTGNMRDWWTSADKAAFQKLQDRLAAQYDALCPFDEGKTCVNGRLTMGENIGDLGGLSLAYRAYKLSLNGKQAPVIDGVTGDQRFFMAWAQVWRSKVREAQARQYLVTDPHSPPQYRINGIVRNFDEWYKAFDVKPGDALYLAPKDRVRIW